MIRLLLCLSDIRDPLSLSLLVRRPIGRQRLADGAARAAVAATRRRSQRRSKRSEGGALALAFSYLPINSPNSPILCFSTKDYNILLEVNVNIIFDINEKTIDSRYAELFERIKEFIISKTQYNIVLRGYTCSIGSLEYNLKLSKERVDATKEYLVKKLGVDENLIESYFYGEKDAPYDNTSEEERRKNRVVNIQVIGK